MLIMADVFAVVFYRGTANWMQIKRLVPWVIPGLLIGTETLVILGHAKQKDLLNPIIGWIVLVMLAVSLLRGKWGEKLAPTSKLGTAITGALAGFTTMISNAAGPVMGIFLTAAKMPKDEIMGNNAWYFFIFNLTKLPLMAYVALENPANPVMTRDSLLMNVALFPLIVVGAFAGKVLFTKIPQKLFSNAILILALVAAIKLIFT